MVHLLGDDDDMSGVCITLRLEYCVVCLGTNGRTYLLVTESCWFYNILTTNKS